MINRLIQHAENVRIIRREILSTQAIDRDITAMYAESAAELLNNAFILLEACAKTLQDLKVEDNNFPENILIGRADGCYRQLGRELEEMRTTALQVVYFAGKDRDQIAYTQQMFAQARIYVQLAYGYIKSN